MLMPVETMQDEDEEDTRLLEEMARRARDYVTSIRWCQPIRVVKMQYKPYVPQNIGELLNQVGSMMLAAPTFKDKTGYLPRENIDTAFFSLNEGLQVVREILGEEHYAALKAMSDKMRALFESDPDDKTGDTQAGRMLIPEMEDILVSVAKREASK